ncbi:23S rRNA (adenine(2503)-C(2))-methyltransferase RlmN [Candidatus Dependentiae bacterium]
MKENLINLTIFELKEKFLSLCEKPYRANQSFDWIYKKTVFDTDLFSNFTKDLKEKINQNLEIKIPRIHDVTVSEDDNSYKFLLKTEDQKLIESILMISGKRATICVSCMIGCPLKCKFCATGSELKFLRKLEISEIVGQVLSIQKYIKENNVVLEDGKTMCKVTNIVFMGMGEPLLNLKNIEKTIQIFLDKNAFDFSKNRITLSTSGVTTGLSDLINKFQIKLAVSLHFPTDEQRSEFMPINISFSLQKLIDELKKIKLEKRSFITIEYIMLNKINDTILHAKKLIKVLHGLKVKINLIPYNSTKSLPVLPSSEEQINLFAKYLRSKKIMVTIRRSKGKKIKGGCGQFILSKGNNENQ